MAHVSVLGNHGLDGGVISQLDEAKQSGENGFVFGICCWKR